MPVKNARQLRGKMTDAERKLWAALRDRRLDGIKFRRQHPLGPYVFDFFSEVQKLAIEVDGGQHTERAARDIQRTEWLEEHGCRVMRFWNNDVLSNLSGVLTEIACAAGVAPHPLPSGQARGLAANAARDLSRRER
jgi:very-short-patch-repair endonuclease